MESIEVMNIAVGLMVTLIEVIILIKLKHHTNEINGHIRRLDAHVKDLDMHSHRMEENIEKLLKEIEGIYSRVCYPNLNEK